MTADDFVLHPQLAADSIWLADWPLCQLRLLNDQQYPWFLLIPRVQGVSDIIDLTDAAQQQLWLESRYLSHWLRSDYQPDKLNIAALGNVVPQLHVHHIGRSRNDVAWPAPVWGKFPAKPYSPTQLEVIVKVWRTRSFA